MDIKVGEYVRTKKGKIAKVKTIYSEEDRIKMKNFSVKKETLINGTIKIPDIVKHSFNIIDLIEVGDYVNGLKITLINEPSISNCYRRIVYAEDENGYLIKNFSEDDIKTIVTKEQFESMEYKVGD